MSQRLRSYFKFLFSFHLVFLRAILGIFNFRCILFSVVLEGPCDLASLRVSSHVPLCSPAHTQDLLLLKQPLPASHFYIALPAPDPFLVLSHS